MSNLQKYLFFTPKRFIYGSSSPHMHQLGYLQPTDILTITKQGIGVLSRTIFVLAPKVAIKCLSFTTFAVSVHHP
jgi:hypothetical protein